MSIGAIIAIIVFILGISNSIKNVGEKTSENKQNQRTNRTPRTYMSNEEKRYSYGEEYPRSSTRPSSTRTRQNQYQNTQRTKQNTQVNERNINRTNYERTEEIGTKEVLYDNSNNNADNLDIEMNMNTLKNGILLSQILEEPRSKNPHRLYSYRRPS